MGLLCPPASAAGGGSDLLSGGGTPRGVDPAIPDDFRADWAPKRPKARDRWTARPEEGVGRSSAPRFRTVSGRIGRESVRKRGIDGSRGREGPRNRGARDRGGRGQSASAAEARSPPRCAAPVSVDPAIPNDFRADWAGNRPLLRDGWPGRRRGRAEIEAAKEARRRGGREARRQGGARRGTSPRFRGCLPQERRSCDFGRFPGGLGGKPSVTAG